MLTNIGRQSFGAGFIVKVYQFDIDENKSKAGEAEVESVPTFIIYRNGKEMWRNSGEMEGEVLLSKIESVL